jgi:hypothetical protein
MENTFMKSGLLAILNNLKTNHLNNILEQISLKNAHIYCKINNLSGQITGPLIENFIKIKYGMSKNNASHCNGDLLCGKKNIEIKVSNGGKDHNKFNYVQLRVNHDCEYILTAYYISVENINNLGELFIFRLNKDEMINLIIKHGKYAHGTIQKLGKIEISINDTDNREYALRPKYGDKCWTELLKYRIDEISI